MTEEQLEALQSATDRSTPWFSLKGMKTIGKVISAYDGDSAHIAVCLYGAIYKLPCRMMMYDSPEMKDGHPDATAAKKAFIRESTGLKESFDTGGHQKLVEVEFFGKDKWGRELVKLYDDIGCINERLLSLAFNLAYNGVGKRPIHPDLIPMS